MKRVVLFLAAFAALVSCTCPVGNDIVARQGYWNCPDVAYGKNTLSALIAAQKAGFYGSEFDVRLTRDSVVMLSESPVVNSLVIADTPWESIRFSGPIENGENPVTLERFLELGGCKDGCVLYCHLQPLGSPELDDLLAAQARRVFERCGLSSKARLIRDHSQVDGVLSEDPMALLLGGKDRRWMRDICSPLHCGRKAGTAGCAMVKDYIGRELRAMGYETEEQNWRFLDSLDFTNICVAVPGKNDSVVVCGAHYDGAVSSIYHQGADDNCSGIVAVLKLAEKLRGCEPEYTTVLAFWTAEEFTAVDSKNGSRHFVQTWPSIDKVRLYVNFDCFARRGQGIMLYYTPGRTDLVEGMEGVILSDELKFNSDYVPFFDAGIPILSWNDENTSGYVHTTDDSIEEVEFQKIDTVVSKTLEMLR